MASDSKLKMKVDEILQEIRIVLPGTQALLGFEFVVFFNPSFQSLATNLKYFHFLTLILTMITTILLIAPVAFQQIGEDGHTTRRFLSFTAKMLNASMFCLLVALSFNTYTAAQLVDPKNHIFGLVAALAVFVFGSSLWFVYSFAKRKVKS